MVRFADKAEINSRYFEKPYYLRPDGNAQGCYVFRKEKGAPTEADAPFSEDLLLGPLHVVYGCRVWLLNPAFAASGLEL